MAKVFKEKEEEKAEQKVKKRFKGDIEIDSEEIQLKKLEVSDLQNVIAIMRRAMFEISKSEIKEIEEIISYGMSYAAYVEGIMVSVGLAWPVHFSPEYKTFLNEEPNAIFLHSIALLVAYEGKGIREKLIDIREKEGIKNGYVYAVSLVGENPKDEDIVKMIEDRGTKEERAFLKMGYAFIKSENGLIAYKTLTNNQA